MAVVAGQLPAQPTSRKPGKKPAAGSAAVRQTTRPSASATAKPKAVAPATHTGHSPVDEAGNRAAAAAAAERVHAWLRDHHEVVADETPAPVAKPAPSHKPVAITASTPAKQPAAPAKDDGHKATTEDFLKAAEQRKSLEQKHQPAETETPEPEKTTHLPPKAEAPAPVVHVSQTEDAEESQPAEPAAIPAERPRLTTAKSESTRLAKPAIEEKAASELPAPPVLAVKRTELVEESPAASLPQPKLTFRRGRLVVPAPLLGSHAILVRQNVVADRYGLERVQDDADLERLRKAKQLVALPDNRAMQVDDRLSADRRYARPWAVKFLNDLGRAHYDRFHGPLQVNSAVRTVEFQQRLLRTNGNAAPAEGDTASPHLTGQAIDLAKHGLSMTEIAWMRAYLLPLVQEGKIDVEEEFQQACFHISVYKNYVPEPKTKEKPGKSRLPKASLATALP
ncbi:DUF5715 family protein [Terriglobus albidus]|uniref:DUF5715 family protein n=1 Tax=Terriglobus albidus TaxID=1592106 RepID=UPI0021E0D772|nr:DUF5715 family protein [Terriglobus albidus]